MLPIIRHSPKETKHFETTLALFSVLCCENHTN